MTKSCALFPLASAVKCVLSLPRPHSAPLTLPAMLSNLSPRTKTHIQCICAGHLDILHPRAVALARIILYTIWTRLQDKFQAQLTHGYIWTRHIANCRVNINTFSAKHRLYIKSAKEETGGLHMWMCSVQSSSVQSIESAGFECTENVSAQGTGPDLGQTWWKKKWKKKVHCDFPWALNPFSNTQRGRIVQSCIYFRDRVNWKLRSSSSDELLNKLLSQGKLIQCLQWWICSTR